MSEPLKLHRKKFSLNIVKLHSKKNSISDLPLIPDRFNPSDVSDPSDPRNSGRHTSKNYDSFAPTQRTASEHKYLLKSRSSSKDLKFSIKRELSPDEQEQVEKIVKQKMSSKYDLIKSSISKKITLQMPQVFGEDLNMLRTNSLAAVQAGKLEKQILPNLKREAITEVLTNRKIQPSRPSRELILSEMQNALINKHEFVPTKLFGEGDTDMVRACEEAQKSLKAYGVKPIKPICSNK